jgi:hypothetical protein
MCTEIACTAFSQPKRDEIVRRFEKKRAEHSVNLRGLSTAPVPSM